MLCAANARSEDDKGQYAVRGAGLISCGLYVRERGAKDDVYLITAAWVDGYITGINHYAPQTYDLLSFESTELLMSILDKHCKSHPTDPVFGVLTSLFKKLWQDRLTDKSDKTVISVEGRETQHYMELVKRLQIKLRAGGFYEGAIALALWTRRVMLAVRERRLRQAQATSP